MELAHVVYKVSTDADYADRFESDPESTLEKLGLRLDKDEVASLLSVIRGHSGGDVLMAVDRPGLSWW